ncbi:MAG TPA: IS66 family transposase, partial [Gaiellaceae bacterium]|nr:IS66 family transposase [Gaiellaceae bacterium]
MEQRFAEVFAQQQKIIADQAALIEKLTGEQAALIEKLRSEHDGRVQTLETEVARLTRELIGRKSEKIKIPPVERDQDAAEPPDEHELARRREAAERKRRERALARGASLEQQEVEHPVPEDMKKCPKCGGTHFTEMPPETSATIDYVPGRFVRRRHRRQKLACRCGDCIVTAPAPKLVEGGHYGPGFAAFLVVEKCADSIPIYRIEKRMLRLGIPISRATMNDLVHTAAEIVRPLVARLAQRIAGVEIVLADETSMRIQDRTKKGFVWVFHGRDDAGSGGELVLYVFATDRSGGTPLKILGGSEGTLVADGYTGYNIIEDPTERVRGGCWCHARRKAFEALATAPVEAQYMIDELRKVFRVEHEATERRIVGTREHLVLRQQQSKPIIDKLFEWLIATQPTV